MELPKTTRKLSSNWSNWKQKKTGNCAPCVNDCGGGITYCNVHDDCSGFMNLTEGETLFIHRPGMRNTAIEVAR